MSTDTYTYVYEILYFSTYYSMIIVVNNLDINERQDGFPL